MRAFSKNLLWAIISLILISLIFSLLFDLKMGEPAVLRLDGLAQKIKAGEVKSILVAGNTLKITFSDSKKALSRKEAEASLSETLRNYGVEPEILVVTENMTRQ